MTWLEAFSRARHGLPVFSPSSDRCVACLSFYGFVRPNFKFDFTWFKVSLLWKMLPVWSLSRGRRRPWTEIRHKNGLRFLLKGTGLLSFHPTGFKLFRGSGLNILWSIISNDDERHSGPPFLGFITCSVTLWVLIVVLFQAPSYLGPGKQSSERKNRAKNGERGNALTCSRSIFKSMRFITKAIIHTLSSFAKHLTSLIN